MNDIWVEAHSAEERWQLLRKVGSGGQAHGYAGKALCQTGSCRFIKILREQTNPERRARMFREAAALSTYQHTRIPQLIESNAQKHMDNSFKLYLVTDFIEGINLSRLMNNPLSLLDAGRITDELADAVEYLQIHSAVHRDIKPENVILRGNKNDAVLVDFGMTFNLTEPPVLETGDWQEVGNRFLRLPELSAFSTLKRDFRTDLAFLTGILFFPCLDATPRL